MIRNIIKKCCVGLLITTIVFGNTGCGREKTSDQISYRKYGINCIEAGKYEEAVSALQKALDESVGGIGELELDICMYKAKAQYLMGDIASAEETYTAVIEYNNSADAYYLRGCMYFATGDTAKAAEDFANAVKEDKNNIELYVGIVENFKKYQCEEKAAEYIKKATEIKCKKADDYMQMGRIYILSGDYDAAVKSLNTAIEEGQVKANFYMGQAYAAKGDDTLAQTFYEEYIAKGEADSYELFEIGKSQMSKEDFATAVTYFKAALELEEVPNKQAVLRNLAISYEKMGDFASARDTMAEYVKLYPEDDEAKEEYTFLQTR